MGEVKWAGSFSKLLFVHISEKFEFEGKMVDRKDLRKEDGKVVRYSWPFQGPGAWRRSRNQTQYRVKVWDARGQILHGWVTLGTYWGFMDWYKVSDVTWN